MATRVVGYVRVSTEEQAAGGVSLDAQREKIAAYARLHDLDLVAVEEDAGVSAKTLDRPGLRRALALLDTHQADGLLIAKLDRLSRSLVDWQRLIAGYFGGRAQLFSVSDSINTATAAGRMVLNVLMTIAQWERETIVERTRDALAHKRARGERTGGVPYGWALAADGRTLAPHADEQRGLARMRALRASGLSYRHVGRALDAEGFPPKSGGRWGHESVRKILAAEATRPCAPASPS